MKIQQVKLFDGSCDENFEDNINSFLKKIDYDSDNVSITWKQSKTELTSKFNIPMICLITYTTTII